MASMLDILNELEQSSLAELDAVADAESLEAWRIAYIGSKGRLTAAMAGLKDVPKQDKPAVGKRSNEVKNTLKSAFEARKASLDGAGQASAPVFDLTEPGLDPALGRRHILSRVREQLCETFGRMGFAVAAGPELEDDEHNFVKLNIPADHPAREPIDNFYVEEPDHGPRPRMLRSQTSTVQIRTMEDAVAKGWGPPIKVIAPGRVYRPDTVDATHSYMFHQLEGLYVDRNVTMVELKQTLLHFAREFFGPDAEVRLRPSFFPFTEPSAEFDMKIALKPDQPPDWIELGGCGMVDPAVFEAVGIDPEEWTGYAFGFGIERVAMGRYSIPDIRMLFDNDLRFLQQL
ncbi:MAG: phenylalanine--tRNA ligase subunit alpha [Planctomycetota bacterium]